MLSYMLPIDDKPPQMPNKTHLQLELDADGTPVEQRTQQQQQQQHLTNGHPKKQQKYVSKTHNSMVHAGSLSKESSTNSFDGVATPPSFPHHPHHHHHQQHHHHHPVKYASKCGGTMSKDSSVNSFASGGDGCVVVAATASPTPQTRCLKQTGATTLTSMLSQHQHPYGSISKESSISSFVSDATTATASQSSMTPTSTISDKPKTKFLSNGATKHTGLKRVSFGSSKGSMVETLIYESPLQEEPENSPTVERTCPFPADGVDQTEAERSKVRVTFYQQSTPLVVSTPPPSLDLLLDDLFDADTATIFNMASGATVAQQPTSLTTVVTETTHVQYSRQESTESGWDNPFRPGGELSREAEEIVELIKGGKPITPTPGSVAPGLPSVDETDVAATPATTPASTVDAASPLTQSPVKKSTANELNATPKSTTNNGYTANNATAPASKTAKQPASPGAVDVKRDNVGAPADGSQVEHVVLKKKPRCKCCVIQ